MPAAIPALIVIATAGTAYATIGLIISAFASYLIADHQKSKARRQARDAYNASLQDRLVMAATTNGPRSRLYGQARNVDGVIFKAPHGTHSEFYVMVVALAGHECESIEKVYFNDQELALSSDGAGGWWVQTTPFLREPVISALAPMTTVGTTATVTLPHTPVSGSVSCLQFVSDESLAVPYTPTSVVGNLVTITGVDPAHTTISCNYQYIDNVPKARIWKYLGTDAQDIGSDLLASRFPGLINTGSNDDRFAGICCVVVELEFDQDAFPTGLPSVTGLVRGAKCYDPRTGLTEWTQNPPTIARDFSLYAYGGNCSTGELNQPAIIAAANACDVSTDFETAEGTETRPLYQCDIVCRLDAPPDKHLEEIVESMAGKWGWAGGQLTMVAGVYRAPVATITEDWISDSEDISLIKDQPRSDAVNTYLPSIAAADIDTGAAPTYITHAYTQATVPPVRSTEYIAADGEELVREVQLGGVVHNVHAQHVCAVLMRDSRFFMSMQLPCKMHAWPLEMFDVVAVTLPFLGFTAQTFEVVGWRFSMDKGVMLTLKKIDAEIFDVAATFELPDWAANTSLVLPWVVPAVEGLTVDSGISTLEDGTPQTRVLVSWDESTSESVLQSGKIEVQYAEINDTTPAWFNAPPVDGSATSVTITGLRQNRYYIFRARQVNTLRVRSVWSTQVVHLVAVPPDEAAAAAQAAADAALDALDDIASDGLLTPVEKHRVMVEVNVLLAEQTGIDATATAQGITTELTAYDDAVDDLTTYLATLTAPTDWDDVSGNTAVVRATFNGWFEAVYAARQDLLNLIAVTIANGAVGTPQLAPGAATELFSQDQASLTQNGYDNLINYTATADCTVVLKVECLATAQQDAGPTSAVYTARMSYGAAILLAGTSTVVATAAKQTRYATIGNSPAEIRLTSLLQYEMEEGDDWDFGMRLVGDYFPDLNWDFTEGNTQLEVIKR